MALLITTAYNIPSEAFEYYYSLGNNRSLDLVAKKFNRTVRTISNWKRNYFWDDQIFQRDTENGKINPITALKTDHRIFISNLMKTVSDKIVSGEIAVNSIEDLVTVIKLDLLLMGEPTNITKSLIVDLPEELRILLDKKIDELQKEK